MQSELFLPEKQVSVINKMKFSLSNVVTFPGRQGNGIGMTAELLADNKLVAYVSDYADGSSKSYNIVDYYSLNALEKILVKLPSLYIEANGNRYKLDLDRFIDILFLLYRDDQTAGIEL